jgi:hypothetical protein
VLHLPAAATPCEPRLPGLSALEEEYRRGKARFDDMTSPNILGVLARVFVDDVDGALPVYRAMVDDAEPQCFTCRDVRLARVGPWRITRYVPR